MTEIILDENIDWDNRVLCSDESCIGVIGPDGKCIECGRVFEGELPQGFASNSETVNAGLEDQKGSVAGHPSDDDWDNRVLCPDGACIGVIGPGGKCKECGKPING